MLYYYSIQNGNDIGTKILYKTTIRYNNKHNQPPQPSVQK